MNTISKDTFSFLSDLNENNNREWFLENKPRWESVKAGFLSFVDVLMPEIYKIDPSVGVQTAAKCMYRLHRDTRFSKDKTPYKTHIAVFIASGGVKQHGKPGYYLHLGIDECVLGGGVFMPTPENLDKIRKEIYYNIDQFKSILNDKSFRKYYNGLWDIEKLKMAPKNFPKDFPDIDLLKYKHYSINHDFEAGKAFEDGFGEYVLEGIRNVAVFNQFMNEALMD